MGKYDDLIGVLGRQAATPPKGITLLSPFDGAGGARTALEGMGIPVNRHLSAEYDRAAQQVLARRYPDIVQYGDVRNMRNLDGEPVDLMCAGFPCQELSKANPSGRGLGGDRSGPGLREALRIRDEFDPTYWMFENVVPKRDEDMRAISQMVGVEPVIYNAADFGPMARERAFWTNIPQSPHGRSQAMFRDALDTVVPERYMKPGAADYMYRVHADGKTPWQRHGKDINDPKVRTLTAGLSKGMPFNVVRLDDGSFRMMTPEEVEGLFGFPRGATEGVSNTQRYKMLGNSWSVPTVQHVLRGLIPE
jgi:site-specific DNA-cytosine methylase